MKIRLVIKIIVQSNRNQTRICFMSWEKEFALSRLRHASTEGRKKGRSCSLEECRVMMLHIREDDWNDVDPLLCPFSSFSAASFLSFSLSYFLVRVSCFVYINYFHSSSFSHIFSSTCLLSILLFIFFFRFINYYSLSHF